MRGTVKSCFHIINHKECKKTTQNIALYIKKYKKQKKNEKKKRFCIVFYFFVFYNKKRFFYDKKRLVFYTRTTLVTTHSGDGILLRKDWHQSLQIKILLHLNILKLSASSARKDVELLPAAVERHV